MYTKTKLAALAAVALGALCSSAWAEDAAPLKIGVVAAQTGAFVSAGNTIGAGVGLAVKEINDAGGVKIDGKPHKVDLLNRDDRTDVNVAIAAGARTRQRQ